MEPVPDTGAQARVLIPLRLSETEAPSLPVVSLAPVVSHTSEEGEDGSSKSGSGDLTDDVLRTTIAFFVPDVHGRAFWSTHFLHDAAVQWERFATAVGSWAGAALSPADRRLLLAFLAQLAGGTLNRDLDVVPPPTISVEMFGIVSVRDAPCFVALLFRSRRAAHSTSSRGAPGRQCARCWTSCTSWRARRGSWAT